MAGPNGKISLLCQRVTIAVSRLFLFKPISDQSADQEAQANYEGEIVHPIILKGPESNCVKDAGGKTRTEERNGRAHHNHYFRDEH